MNRRRTSLLAVTVLLIALATLTPQPGEQVARVSSFCIACGELGTPDLLLNVLLFLPLGVALGVSGFGVWRALAIGLALSAAIEVAQLLIPGRYPTLRDVLLNGVGCGLGVILPSALAALLRPSRYSAAWLWTSCAASVVVVVATGWLLRFDPSPGELFVHWSPRQGHLEPWTGSVNSASISGWPIEAGRAREPAAIRALLSDSLRLRVQGIGGAPTTGLGGIVSISDQREHEVLLAGPDGTDLVVRARRRASRLRLDAPAFTFPELLAATAAGSPFDLEVRTDWRAGCASVGRQRHCVTAASAGSAWTLIRPFPALAAPWRAGLNAMTLLLLVLPVGTQFQSVSRRQATAAGVATIGGVALAAVLVGLGLPTPIEWLGLLGGLGAGLLARRAMI